MCDRGRFEPLVRDPGRDDLRLLVAPEDEQSERGAVAADRARSIERAGLDGGRGVGPRAFVVAGHQPAPDHRDRPAPASRRRRPPARVVLVCGTQEQVTGLVVPPEHQRGEPRRPGRPRETREPEVLSLGRPGDGREPPLVLRLGPCELGLPVHARHYRKPFAD